MARLGDICEIVSGTTPKSNVPEYWDGEINWVTPAELDDDSRIIYESQRKITEQAVKDSSLKSFPSGTVLLSSRAPIGKVAIAGTEMYCNQGFKNLICSEKIYNKYLFWFLKGKTEYLNSLGRGATFKEISKGIVENIEIPLPLISEQKHIAELLDGVSNLILLRQQQLAKLDELVKARFVEMFGDPVQKSNRSPHVPMTELCEIIDGDRGTNYPKQEEFSEEGYCLFLNTKNVTAQGFSFDNCQYITAEKDALLHKGRLCRGDIVLTTRGTIGNLAFYNDSVPFENMRINSGMVILRIDREILKEIFFIEQFKILLTLIKEQIASGSAQPQLPISAMYKILILLPDIDKQKIFSNFVEKINRQSLTIQQSLDKLDVLKKALMQEYFG